MFVSVIQNVILVSTARHPPIVDPVPSLHPRSQTSEFSSTAVPHLKVL